MLPGTLSLPAIHSPDLRRSLPTALLATWSAASAVNPPVVPTGYAALLPYGGGGWAYSAIHHYLTTLDGLYPRVQAASIAARSERSDRPSIKACEG